MSIKDKLASAEVGDVLFTEKTPLGREDLVRYAGAGGDFNVIHYNDAAANAAGLPGVIAHGMLSMGIVSRLALEWAGERDSLRSFGGRFSAMFPIPNPPEHAELTIVGRLAAVDDDAVTLSFEILATDGTPIITDATATFALD